MNDIEFLIEENERLLAKKEQARMNAQGADIATKIKNWEILHDCSMMIASNNEKIPPKEKKILRNMNNE